MGVPLTGVHLRDVYQQGVQLMDVHAIDVPLSRVCI
jgi:hypothetical protein